MLKNIFTLPFLLLFNTLGFSQSADVPYNPDYYHLIDRLEIRSGKLMNGFQSSVKPFSRKNVVELTDSLLVRNPLGLAEKDFGNITYLQNDNWEWLGKTQQIQAKSNNPIGKILEYKNDVYGTETEEYGLHISPTFNFGGILESDSENKNHFMNTRGVEVRGTLGKKVGFYSHFSENQMPFPSYLNKWTQGYRAFPNEGFWKKVDNGKIADFISARGYITFSPIKQIEMKFGHDKNFIGSGIRSVILSDFSAPYPFLRINTHVGKVQYTNIFAEMVNYQEYDSTLSNRVHAKKFMAFHRVGINIGKNTNLGFSETIMFAPRDRLYDMNYLNPLIFYRFAEGHIGSPDNVLIGADVKVNLFKRMSVYGQFLLDEFLYDSLRTSSNSWLNKVAFQAGFKYINVLSIPTLDFQIEWNFARPYTYSHFSSSGNYLHYNQPIAHPLGANFSEQIIVVRYQIGKRLFLTSHFIKATFGEDPPNQNWGGDLRKNYYTGQINSGNKIGQGRKTETFLWNPRASYMIRHNLFLDTQFISRIYSSADARLDKTSTTFLVNLRWNMPNRAWHF